MAIFNGLNTMYNIELMEYYPQKEFYFYSAAKAGWNALGSGGEESVWMTGTAGVYLEDFLFGAPVDVVKAL